MDIWATGLLLAILIATSAAFLWVVFELRRSGDGKKQAKKGQDPFTDAAEKDVEHIFNDAFREELRNRGRLHFENIISENAMFLQQDLRLTTSQLNEFMKTEITRTLKEEFSKYEQSIADAKQLAVESITKIQTALEQQREVLGQQLEQQVEATKVQLVARFEENMADIVNHYIMAAMGDQIDLTDQLEYILGDLEANKQAIVEDINNGA